MTLLRKYSLLIFTIFLALVLRLILSPYGDNNDLLTNAGWGEWVYKHGARGFYENSTWIYAWPTQLPFINLLYGFNYFLFDQKLLWLFSYIEAVIKTHNIFPGIFSQYFDFVYWFGTSLFKDSPFRNGFLVSMKLIPILSDILLGIIIYIFGRKIVGVRKSLLISALFLFLPASWYVSSLWGQYDQLSTLLFIGSLLLLYKRGFLLSSILLFLSIQVKPTIIFLAPFYIYYFLYLKPSIKSFLLSGLGVALTFLLVTSFFTDKNPIIYTFESIYPKVFNNDRFGLVNHSFNFWQMLAPFGGWSTTFRLIGIPALYLGLAFLVTLNFLAVRHSKKDGTLKGLIGSFYLIAGGSYLFGTGMVDRYFYPALVLLGLAVFYYPKLLKWYVLTIIIFSFNLFYSWGFPILTDLSAWKNELIIRIFSFLNITVFIMCIRQMNIKFK